MPKYSKINTKILKADLDKFAKVFSQTVASTASEKIEELSRYAIERFYADYSPKYYVRTGNFRNSVVPFVKVNKNIYQGGVFISIQQMSEYKHGHYSVSKILDNSWIKGTHGIKVMGSEAGKIIYGRTGFKPDEYVRKNAYTRQFRNIISDIGIQKAINSNYSLLRF